ncbi:MAG: helix-turn-helix domain-containing protein [Alphaproteobacteria bacterium]
MTTRSYRRQDCPIAYALSVVGDQWTLLLIRDLLSGVHRFEALQKKLGLSRNLLARRLKQLASQGLVTRDPLPGTKRFAYRPTPKCEALWPTVLALAEWGQAWRGNVEGTRVEITESDSGKAVGVRYCRLEDGREVAPDRIVVERIRP